MYWVAFFSPSVFVSCISVESTESLLCLFFLPADQIQQLCAYAEILSTSPGLYSDFHAMAALKLCVPTGWCSKSMCAASNATKFVGAASKKCVLRNNLFGSTLQELGMGIITSGSDADFDEKLEMLTWLMTINTALARKWNICTSSEKNREATPCPL